MHYCICIICDYNNAYIVAKGKICVRGTNDANRINKKLTFKDNTSVRSCISKINKTIINCYRYKVIEIKSMIQPMELMIMIIR